MNIRRERTPLCACACMIAACLLWTSGCARIADPQPPVALIPKAASDLSASQLANSIVLKVSIPDQNTDGSDAEDLRSAEVFRITQPMPGAQETAPLQPLPEKEFLAQASVVLSVPSAQFSARRHNNYLILRDEPELPPGAGIDSLLFRYAVAFINHKGRAAGLSNQAAIRPVIIAAPPEDLTVQSTEKAIILKWKAPLQDGSAGKTGVIAGYNIYRSENAASFPPLPVHAVPLQKTEYYDSDFKFDKTYFYAVSTVGKLRDPFAESLPSRIVEVKTPDVFPPAPPSDFNAVMNGKEIVLFWTPSPSQDAAGYRLYREDARTSSRRLLSEALIPGFSWQDKGAESGGTLRYVIHAVDKHGNESAAVITELSIP